MSTGQRSAFVHGAAVSMTWADASRSLTDLIFDGVSAALADAGIGMDQVDSVVLAAHDLIDGRSLSSMVTAPAAGAYLRDEIRLADDGLAALSLGAARVAAGESVFTVVAGWGRASEADFVSTSRAAMDPFMAQPLGLTEFDVSAFRLSRWLGTHPGRGADRAAAAEQRARRAGFNPRAVAGIGLSHPMPHPIRVIEGPRWADVVAAAVIGAAPAPVRVAGVGHGTDMPEVGERDLLAMPALRAAAAMASAAAGIRWDGVDLYELDGMTLSDEVLSLEALGLCTPGDGFTAYAASDRINRSGGAGAGWCYPAMGLARFVEAYLQLTRKAGAVQYAPPARTALATGMAPIGGQTQTAVILEVQ